MGKDVDERPCAIAPVEPDAAQQLAIRRADDAVRVLCRRNTGQLKVLGKLPGEVGVVNEIGLLPELCGDTSLPNGPEEFIGERPLIVQRRPTVQSPPDAHHRPQGQTRPLVSVIDPCLFSPSAR